jgi:hypothetical protein
MLKCATTMGSQLLLITLAMLLPVNTLLAK